MASLCHSTCCWQIRANHPGCQYCRLRLQLVSICGLGGVGESTVYRIVQVDLPIDDVIPACRQSVFKVHHKHFHIGVQRFDHHFALYWSGDLHSVVEQILRHVADLTLRIRNWSHFRNKNRQAPYRSSAARRRARQTVHCNVE